MRGSVIRAPEVFAALAIVCAAASCARELPPPPLVPQTSGTIGVAGLSAPVRIVRDRWGIAHIYAESQSDLFLAQGLVQAQDRLFQIDLRRRAVQGRLSQVLGANFIERDAMTRRMRFRGDPGVEWASYGIDARSIAAAFTRGINTWVDAARQRPPEEFVRAGWQPEFWSPDDLLNRTDAFLASADALDEIRRRNLSDVVADAVRRVGTAPFFIGANAPDDQTRVRSGFAAALEDHLLRTGEARRRLDHPSFRYLVHLNAPGWNVIGATSPWLPGVAIGHNERIAWGGIPIAPDTQDVYIDDAAAPRRVIKEAVVVKGRSAPFVFDSELSEHGVVIASDRGRHLVYSLRWSGFEPGAAGELAAIDVDRAGSWAEFRHALASWKMPARRMLYADVDGNVGFQDAALVPVRRGGEWTGSLTLDRLPHALNARMPQTVAAAASNDTSVSDDALFFHPLATSAATRQRFNVGPLPRPSADDSPVRLLFDTRDWDRSRAMNAPGQSGAPSSPHFSDLAKLWSQGETVPLAFSDAEVQKHTEATLTLVPK